MKHAGWENMHMYVILIGQGIDHYTLESTTLCSATPPRPFNTFVFVRSYIAPGRHPNIFNVLIMFKSRRLHNVLKRRWWKVHGNYSG